MTHSEEVINKVRARYYMGGMPDCVETLILEYELAIADNLKLEAAIHALCKRIDELPSAK